MSYGMQLWGDDIVLDCNGFTVASGKGMGSGAFSPGRGLNLCLCRRRLTRGWVADTNGRCWPKAGVRVAGDAGAIALPPIVAGVEKVRQGVKAQAAANLTNWI